MNKRAMEILNLLVRRPEYKLTDLERTLHLTKRQINYSITQINESLDEKNLPQITRNKAGDFFIPLEIMQALTVSESIYESSDYLSDNERLSLLLLYLLTSDEIISLAHLTDLLNVSKNTVMNDLRTAEIYLKRWQLQLEYSRAGGYDIRGSEVSIRLLLNEQIQKNSRCSKKVSGEVGTNTITRDDIIHLIRLIEVELDLTYADVSFDFLIEAILLTLDRVHSKRVNEREFFSGKVDDTVEYKTIMRVIPKEWGLKKSDLEWITLLFLSSNTYSKSNSSDSQQDMLKKYIQEMVSQFQIQTMIEIEERLQFEKRLYDHLRPAYFRIRYDLKLGSYNLENLISENHHSILNQLMKDLVAPLEMYIGKKFPSDELELLSFYFGSQLNTKKESDLPKKRAVVVCINGLIASKMMLQNLKNLFPELHFLSSFSLREFKKFESDYDLVFTTVALDTSLPQYLVDPLMNYKEQISLRYRVLKENGISELEQIVEDLTHIISRNSQIVDFQNLQEELTHFFIANKKEKNWSDVRVMPTLDKYVQLSYIQIVDKKLEWQEAICIAAKPLIEQGIISESYVESLILQTQDPNNYSFLGPQMSIPHAEPEKGVLKEGISILISKQPIIYPGGQVIHIVSPIAILDLSKHLRAINQLADFASSTQKVTELLELESAEDIWQMIKKLR